MEQKKKDLLENAKARTHHKINVYYHAPSGDSYIDRQIVDCVKSTGPSDTDFVVKKKVIDKEFSISETINSQAPSVGVENFVKRVSAGLDTFTEPVQNDTINDFTGAPTCAAEAFHLRDKIKSKLAELPPDLVAGRSVDEFLSFITEESLNKWIDSKKAAEKVEDPK